jgi:hypothetical protein
LESSDPDVLYKDNWPCFYLGTGTQRKDFLQQAKEDLKGVEYCPYCMEPRNDKRSCCEENHFINFEDLDDDTQTQIVQDEYDLGNK